MCGCRSRQEPPSSAFGLWGRWVYRVAIPTLLLLSEYQECFPREPWLDECQDEGIIHNNECQDEGIIQPYLLILLMKGHSFFTFKILLRLMGLSSEDYSPSICWRQSCCRCCSRPCRPAVVVLPSIEKHCGRDLYIIGSSQNSEIESFFGRLEAKRI